jgi:hypothetical protein
MLREFLTTQILRRIVGHVDIDPKEAPMRAALVASQMMGLIMARYIIRVEPIASTSRESLVTMIAPTVQRYLTGPLAGLDQADAPQ